ncbi:HU family DNA-binding protein [Ferrimonas balearica]|uniref:HU family DNA-binding protein n=1 Tax=Ferrimonas balearica TaxID=44012 RepID=UPI002D7F042B|nr:HU family DNA-binding protein [Ferrimonas balearica]MBY6093824.1 HU family DNA-binding protein [Ferrimonas balearica]
MSKIVRKTFAENVALKLEELGRTFRSDTQRTTYCRAIVSDLFQIMFDRLCDGERVRIRGMGLLRVLEKSERPGRNPKDPDQNIMIPARRSVSFTKTSVLSRQAEESTDSRESAITPLMIEVLERDYGIREKNARLVISAFWEPFQWLRSDRWIEVRGFGRFKMVEVPKKVRNPRSGESLGVKKVAFISFKMSEAMDKKLNRW